METAEAEFHVEALRLITETDSLRNLIFSLVGGSRAPFEAPSVPVPEPVPAELAFIRMVSWLFVLYFETARISVRFLLAKFPTYGIDSDGRLATHFRAVRCLRTLFQHHLELTNPDDIETREVCYRWYADHCGTAVPDSDGHWRKCLAALILQAVEFVRSLAAAGRSIEQDESREGICSQWRSRLERYRTPLECERLVSAIASDMGREHLDPTMLTKRHHQKWMQQVELWSPDVDMEDALRSLIEATILSETIPALPINGHDIMNELDITPGKQVGHLLELARKLYEENPCGREQLLTRLRECQRRSS